CPFFGYCWLGIPASGDVGEPLWPCRRQIVKGRGSAKMKTTRTVSAVLIALGIGMAAPASAMPRMPAAKGDDLVAKVQVDCHQDVRRHYLPRYDRRVLHRHRQSDCRVIIVDREDDYEVRPRDCHREVRRHYLPEYGRSVYHKHVGESCRIRVYNRHQGSDSSRRNCVKLGPITVCED
ncbi:MAG: hypothetical protein M3Y43_10275, partial [Pseudomonadota bacterium]|nr:hypothetical protein [Pseudomonadota bacterium]